MLGITDLTTFIIGTTLIVLLPGPNSLYVISIASRYGIKTGYLAAFGVFSGDLILIILTILGAASLLHAFPWLFTVLKLIGALYLGYLGVKLLIAAYRTWHPQPQISKLIANQSTKNESIKPYQTALLISLINPKAILLILFSTICGSKLSLSITQFHYSCDCLTNHKYELFISINFFRCKISQLL